MSRHRWTEAESARLETLFPDHTAAEIASELGLSVTKAQSRAQHLGLRKTPEWIAERARQAMQDPNHPARQSQFPAGQQPWNAGTKGVMKANSGCFKKHQLPHTWCPIGTQRVSTEGYLQVKLTDTRCTRHDYVNVHHLIWRMHGGTIPSGHALVFKDGDRSNVDINNLELITRAELLRRNSVHRHGTEIAQISQLRGAITRQINKRKEINS